MCIRDSRRVGLDQLIGQVAGTGRRHGQLGGGQLRAVQGLPGGGRAVVAVSYTHLRAHETVLDLVCRLLLEKKKKHNITT